MFDDMRACGCTSDECHATPWQDANCECYYCECEACSLNHDDPRECRCEGCTERAVLAAEYLGEY